MPKSLIEQLADRIAQSRRGLEGDGDLLTRQPVRLFSVRTSPDYRDDLMTALKSAESRREWLARPEDHTPWPEASIRRAVDQMVARARTAPPPGAPKVASPWDDQQQAAPQVSEEVIRASPEFERIRQRELQRRLKDMGGLSRMIRDDPQYQEGLNIVIPQEGILNAYPSGDRDALIPLSWAEYQQAIDKRAEFADYIGRIAANEVLKILGSNDVMDGYKISELPKQLHPIESFSDLLGPVETIEQQTLHSDQIFTAISTGDFCSYADAEAAVLMLYVPDMSYSRSGISHALTRLEKHYSKGAKL